MTSPSRLSRLRQRMRSAGLDALLVSSPSDVRYLTGFTGSNALVIVRRRSLTLVTDTRYALQSSIEARGIGRIISRDSLAEAAATARALDSLKVVGFEAQHVTYAQYRQLRRLFPRIEFRSTADIVEDVATVKDRAEVRAIRRAVAITDTVFSELLPLLKPGLTELDIAAEISYRQRRHGAAQDSFEPIVASGDRGALPHGRATDRRIRKGELVTMDFGCVVDGYCSDLTRTVAVGRPAQEQRQAYAIVLEAQAAAIDAARPGMLGRDLDTVARIYIGRAGYGKYFNHSLGHGIGLRIHERPRISVASRDRLRQGNVITIEPGVYVPGRWGLRIEDDVLITASGCTVLTASPKHLIIL
jgi:Xaa-Pro aminopeptidase